MSHEFALTVLDDMMTACVRDRDECTRVMKTYEPGSYAYEWAKASAAVHDLKATMVRHHPIVRGFLYLALRVVGWYERKETA